MSYVVFARKWRPLTFDDVVGQEHITETLKKAITKNRVAHAFIFTGTRGVGKTTTARIMARALNCDKGPTVNPCGECPSCKNILGGASFDVLEIDGASNNSVDDIRELRENIGYTSMGGKYRIFVIDEVHMLTKSAFNALLKTLEEPPPNVIFIFATTEPQKIPATIHSRCQRYDFKRISAEQILAHLIDICTSEKITFEKSALMLVARKADGSMRDSLSLLDQVYSFCQENLTEKEVRRVLGLVGLDVFNSVMDAVATKTAAPALAAVQDVLYQGFDLQEFLLGLQEHIRNLLFARIPGAIEARGIEIEPEIAVQLVKSSERFSEGDLLRMSEIVRKAENELKWSAFPRFHVEITVLKLVFLDRTISIDKLVALASSGGAIEDIASIIPAVVRSATENNTGTDEKKKLNSEDYSATNVQTVSPEAIQPQPQTAPPQTDSPINETELTYEETSEDSEADNETDLPDITPGKSTEPIAVATEPDVQKNVSENSASKQPVWPQFLDYMLKNRPNLGSFLALSYVANETADSLDIHFPSSYRFQFTEVNKKQNRDQIASILQEFSGKSISLQFTLDTEKAAPEELQMLQQFVSIPLTINDEIDREPIIKTVLDVFDGEILN